MAKKKNKQAKGFAPPFLGMVPPQIGKESKKKRDAMAKKLAADVKTNLKRSVDMQRASADSAREQFSQFFTHMMGLHEDLAELLPSNMPLVPGMPASLISPKDLVKSMKEFQELANEHFVRQMDSHVDFIIVTQQKTVDIIPEPPADEETEAEVAEEVDAAEAVDAAEVVAKAVEEAAEEAVEVAEVAEAEAVEEADEPTAEVTEEVIEETVEETAEEEIAEAELAEADEEEDEELVKAEEELARAEEELARAEEELARAEEELARAESEEAEAEEGLDEGE